MGFSTPAGAATTRGCITRPGAAGAAGAHWPDAEAFRGLAAGNGPLALSIGVVAAVLIAALLDAQ